MSLHKNQPFPLRLRFALHGLRHACAAERSLRFQLAVLASVLVVLTLSRPEPVWWAVTLLASAGVLAAELFNTALEHLVDHLHPEVHPNIRVVKDCAAAAVLICATGAVTVGIALFVHLVTTMR